MILKGLFWLLLISVLHAQSTQGIITGRVYDRESGSAVAGAVVFFRCVETNRRGTVPPNSSGTYTIPGLSPGTYRLRVSDDRKEYQPQEIWDLELRVGARLEFDFPLRPFASVLQQTVEHGLELPDNSALLHSFGPDLDPGLITEIRLAAPQSETLASSLSYMVDRYALQNLPLAGRDVFAALVVQPGVTADNATSRGLGLSANGQRPTASNFLLDGVEHNNPLLSGPMAPIAPEAVEEYRISTGNYSAEYGRTTGFVANAVTRSGADTLHGIIYGYFNHDALNAASSLRNAGLNTSLGEFQDQIAELRGVPLPKQPLRELYAGFWAGGPVIRNRMFWSAAFEQFRNRTRRDPIPYQVPIPERLRGCRSNGPGLDMLAQFAPPVATPVGPASGGCANLTGLAALSPNAGTDRRTGLLRVDRLLREDKDQISARLSLSRTSRPDFFFSPYPDFRSGLDVNGTGLAVSYSTQLSPRAYNEARFGWLNRRLGWERPNDDIPTQSTTNVLSLCPACALTFYSINVWLPGSTNNSAYRNAGDSFEFSDRATYLAGRHVLSAGGGALLLRSGTRFEWLRAGRYLYSSVEDFLAGNVSDASASFDRQSRSQNILRRAPTYDRDHSNHQFYGYLQDYFRLSRRITLNAGIRYDWYGTLKNIGTQDAWIALSAGATIEERVRNATLRYDGRPDHAPYKADNNNWAARFGIAVDLTGRGRTVFRSGYGIFYDRPFDNLTATTYLNNLESVNLVRTSPGPQFAASLNRALTSTTGVAVGDLTGLLAAQSGLPKLLWIDENLRTPYAQSWFGGIQHQVSDNLYVEVNQTGALGRKLIATDHVNRQTTSEARARPNQTIDEDIVFRSNFGSSSYLAVSGLARYRTNRAQFQASYTYGHSIDNQSDPLLNHFGDLGGEFGSQGGRNMVAARTAEYDSRADRARSDFDQRHNLVFYSIWELPAAGGARWSAALLRGWRFAQVAGFRSGFPFGVLAGNCFVNCPPAAPGSEIIGNRPNLLPGRTGLANEPARGGRILLDHTAFVNPPAGVLGNVGRNAFRGPGFWNVDLSLAKEFRLLPGREARVIQFRADFFNAFNHTNLGNPGFNLVSASGSEADPAFGYALFGRSGAAPGFPALVPLDESPRRIQLQLKVIF